jgi:hypothetical protein
VTSVNEPEGALKLAANMIEDLINGGNILRTHMQQMAELLGRTVALADMLDEAVNEDTVVMIEADGSNPMSVADYIAHLRQTLLSRQEIDAAFEDQLGTAQMLYEQFLKRYRDEEGEDV